MPLSIYSNSASTDAQLRLGRSQSATADVMSQLASGLRIASVADDPAGAGIATDFDTQVKSYNQAAQNTNDGISMLQTVDGSLSQVQGALSRMRELAVESSTGTISNSDRSNIQTEFAQLQTEITRIANSTSFGSVSLLSSNQTVNLQVGINNTSYDSVAVTVGAADAGTLGVATLKVDQQTNATAALATLDTALSTVSQNRASLGAMQNRLDVALNNDQSASENLGNALGRIQDVDVAQASAQLAQDQVLTQAGIAVLAQANQSPNEALTLLH